MSAFKIPNWLKCRLIDQDDTEELKLLAGKGEKSCFGDIAIESLRKYFEAHSRNSFYRLVRILGFYGVNFFGKLASYSGTQEDYPEVLYIDSAYWQGKIHLLLTNDNCRQLFCSCGISTVKQLHGVPVKNIVVLSGTNLPLEEMISSLHATIVTAHDDLFAPASKPIFLSGCGQGYNKETTEQNKDTLITATFIAAENTSSDYLTPCLTETKESVQSVKVLNLSVRSSNCLRQANILTIAELICKTDQELLSLPHFGKKCLAEIHSILEHLPERKQWEASQQSMPNVIEPQVDLNSKEVLAKLNTKISDLVLSVRSSGCLKAMNIQFIWQLAQLTEQELFDARNLGRKSIYELRKTLEELGFWLGMTFTSEEKAQINSYEHPREVIVLSEAIKKLVTPLCELPLEFLKNLENHIVAERLFKVGRKQTLEELAQQVSLTRERIRQIEKNAIRKIKQQCILELRVIVAELKKQIGLQGGLATLEDLEIDKQDFSAKEQTITSFLLQVMDEALFVDWEFNLISGKGEEWLQTLCESIQEEISATVSDKFFTEQDLYAATDQIRVRFGLNTGRCRIHLINKFYQEKRVSVLENQYLCCGRATKQDQIVLAFKKLFPEGLAVYKKHELLLRKLKTLDPERFDNSNPRAILGRLTDHPDVFLWSRGYFIHKDHVSYNEEVVSKVATWIEHRFDQGHSRFQIDLPFAVFSANLQEGGIPNQYALYTLLRLQNNERIGQRRYPTLVDLQADVDLYEGILKELENFFLQAGGPISYLQLKQEFLVKRGWKVYSLQQNIAAHSEVIYPWHDGSYIHLEYMSVDYAKLEGLLDAIRVKLNSIEGAYSLKGAKKEMNVLWEQACPSASVRTMIKLIRSVDPEDLQIERYFIQFASQSSESISAMIEIEEFVLDKKMELSSHELHEEFCTRRGWSENQLYGAVRKSRLLRSGKSTYLHPKTISWSDSLSQEVHRAMENHLAERNKNHFPHMQIEELIYHYTLPELPLDIQWTRHLLKSVSSEFADFLFFDDAFITVDNDFDIEDLDDMIGFLIGRDFRLGIANRADVEQMLWREGILESGRSIPDDQYFEGSSIVFLQDSDQVGLSPIGWERYGQSV